MILVRLVLAAGAAGFLATGGVVQAKTVLNVASVDNGDLIRMKSHLADFYAKHPDLEVKFNFLDENVVRNEIINDIVSADGGKYDAIVVGMCT